MSDDDEIRISPQTRALANDFVDALPEWVPRPDLVPKEDGDLFLGWYVGKGWQFSVSISAGGMLNYAGLFGHGVSGSGFARFDDCKIPEIIIESLKRVLYSAVIV